MSQQTVKYVHFKPTNALLENPYIGFMDNADSGFDTRLIFQEILWRDFEPQKGKYDYARIENVLKVAQKQQKSVVLRFVPYVLKNEADMPDWAKDVNFYTQFSKAITALGKKFNGNSALYAVDMVIADAPYDGYVHKETDTTALKKIVDAYLHSFSHTHLLGLVANSDWIEYCQLVRPVGFYAEGFGDDYNMLIEYPKKIYQAKNVWKNAPVIFESFSDFTQWKKLDKDIDYIIEQALKWHVSAFNAKSSVVPVEWQGKVERWLNTMGYRFALRTAALPETCVVGERLEISMWLENRGVAPIYNRLPFKIRLQNEHFIWETEVVEIDIRTWFPGDVMETISVPLPNDLPVGKYRLLCGIGGGEYPVVQMAMETEKIGDFYLLDTIKIICG